jgi:hypothetical protein
MAKIDIPTGKRGFAISFPEFWKLYLDAHRKPTTRLVHYLATFVGAGATSAAVWLGEILLCPLGIATAYGMAIASHRFIEHNRPLIQVNALWGALSDLRMLWLAATGGLSAEYRRIGLAPIDIAPATRPLNLR